MKQFKVKEALPKDVGRAIARIDPEDMKNLGLDAGQIIEIEGKRKTAAKVMPCYAEDRGKKIIQIDGIIRENAKVGIDEKVTDRKRRKQTCQKNHACPFDKWRGTSKRQRYKVYCFSHRGSAFNERR